VLSGAANVSNIAASGQNAANTTDADYVAGKGKGGAGGAGVGNPGGAGYVVISY